MCRSRRTWITHDLTSAPMLHFASLRRLTLLSISLLIIGAFGPCLAQQSRLLAADRDGLTGFIPNRGQLVDSKGRTRPDLLYSAESNGAKVFIRSNAISYVFERYADRSSSARRDEHSAEERSCRQEVASRLVEQWRMDVELLGSRAPMDVIEEERETGVRHYYLAHCPEGILDVPTYRRVRLKEVYPHIDMIFHLADGGMKVDFVVRPGGRPADIRLRYVAADEVRLTEEGGIRATTPIGELIEGAPVSFQTIGGSQRPVATRFRIDGGIVTFDVGDYDARETLLIDPVLRWATYYGGANSEQLLGGDPTEVDRSGNALVTGYVDGASFPATPGAHQPNYGGSQDGFLVKFDTGGRLRWATYYGGSGQELPHGVVSDAERNVFIAGHTQSEDLPTSIGAFSRGLSGGRDAFVVKFDSNGVRRWGTYYGGTAFDDGYGLAADSSGSVAMLLTTRSSRLHTDGMLAKPTPGGIASDEGNDMLLAKFDARGDLLWATYYGGSSIDYGYAVGTDTSQAIIISGWTYSTDLPLTNPVQSKLAGGADAFVAKFDVNGVRLWSTYYGGPNRENDHTADLGSVGVSTDREGNVFVGGVVANGGFPTTPWAAQPNYGGGSADGYVIKLDPRGALRWATYVGGNGEDVGTGVAAKQDGAVLLTGWTQSSDLPVTSDCAQCRSRGSRDAFIVRMSAEGKREYVDYFGGEHNDEGFGISFDPRGAVVLAGNTRSHEFPVLDAAQQRKGGGADFSSDSFVALFFDPVRVIITASAALSLPELVVSPGDLVSIPLRLVSSSNLDSVGAGALEATIRFDRTLLLPRGRTPMGRIEGRSRVVTVSGARPAGMSEGVVFDLELTAALGDTNETMITIDSLSWMGAEVATSLEAGRVLIRPQGGWTGYADVALGLSAPTPNPSRGRTLVTYETREPGGCDVVLYDVLGRRVRDLDRRELPGRYVIDVDTGPIAGGTYFIVLQTPSARIIRPLQVLD